MFETIKLPPTVVDHQRLKLHNVFLPMVLFVEDNGPGKRVILGHFFRTFESSKISKLTKVE